MKPNVFLGVLLLAVLAAGAMIFFKRHLVAPAAPAPVVVTAPAPAPSPMPKPSTVVSVAPAPALTPDERQAAIDAEVERLEDWSRNDDPQSLSNILADLKSPEKDIREAAIEAAKQFGSTNAIPALKAAAMNSTDTDEQVEFLQAAQFLELPSIDSSPPTPDQIAAGQKRKAQMQAAGQARMTKQLQTQQPGNAGGTPAPQSPPPAQQQPPPQ